MPPRLSDLYGIKRDRGGGDLQGNIVFPTKQDHHTCEHTAVVTTHIASAQATATLRLLERLASRKQIATAGRDAG